VVDPVKEFRQIKFPNDLRALVDAGLRLRHRLVG
jgi:hypothetical protein